MKIINTTITGLSLLGLSCGLLLGETLAECGCSQGGTEYLGGNYGYPAPARQMGPPPKALSAAVPPGTLGQTYYLPTREIPADKHPRTAMIDVIVRGATEVRVVNVNPHREEDDIDGFADTRVDALWSFETKPLIPGVPHIYKVVFRFSDDPAAQETVRYVRLIPGRIVELTY